MSTSDNTQVDKNLIELISKHWGAYCPSCGAKKDLNNLKILRKIGPASQILSECTSCGMKTFITAFPNLGMHISQVRSDLNSSEFKTFTNPITSDDYLKFYNNTKNITTLSDLINNINKV